MLYPPGNKIPEQEFIDAFEHALKGNNVNIEAFIHPENGEERWVEINMTRVNIDAGDMIIGVARDISERKKAGELLRCSEEKYRTLTENVNVGVYRNTPGPQGKFIEANPTIVKMFGYESRDEFLSLSVADLYEHTEDRKKFNQKMMAQGYVKNEELYLQKKG